MNESAANSRGLLVFLVTVVAGVAVCGGLNTVLSDTTKKNSEPLTGEVQQAIDIAVPKLTKKSLDVRWVEVDRSLGAIFFGIPVEQQEGGPVSELTVVDAKGRKWVGFQHPTKTTTHYGFMPDGRTGRLTQLRDRVAAKQF